jgi:hypothetical protein
MRSKPVLNTLLQSFAFSKLLPGVLIGLFAYRLGGAQGQDILSFVVCMVVFWAAIGIGHGLAELANEKLG